MTDYTLYHDDCLDILPTLEAGSVDAVITDPPYGINYQSNRRTDTNKFKHLKNDNNDSRLFCIPEIYKVLKQDSILAWFCSFKNYAIDYIEIAKLFDIKNVIIWSKGGGGLGDLEHSLATDYELIIVGHKGACNIRGKRHGSVWSIGKVFPKNMVHPTEKPTAIVSKIISTWTSIGDTVLDTFMGSGTTGMACMRTGRNFIGIELDVKYFKIAETRIKNTAGDYVTIEKEKAAGKIGLWEWVNK